MRVTNQRLVKQTVTTFVAMVAVYVPCYFFLDKTIATQIAHLSPSIQMAAANFSLLGAKIPWLFVGAASLIVGLYYYKQAEKNRAMPFLWLALALFIAMAIAAAAKFGLGRARPPLFLQQGIYGFYFLKAQWIYHSTPSGHTARIVSAMTVFSVLLPRWRVVWILIALSVIGGRLFSSAHYLSDVIVAAWLGYFSALWARAIIIRWTE